MTTELYIDRVLSQLPRTTPRREQIATELRGHIAERTAAGQNEADILGQLGDPVALAESYLSAVPLARVSFGRRAVAKFLDVVLVLAVAIPVGWMAWKWMPEQLAPFALVTAIVLGSWTFAIYVIVAEATLGQTVGKRAVAIRVVRESGARISIGQSIVRQL
ncbi:MAG: RDD family protein, partial [Acidobacteria bacterium]|nr:RDD family protein [Acidobacteriota bacterium]